MSNRQHFPTHTHTHTHVACRGGDRCWGTLFVGDSPSSKHACVVAANGAYSYNNNNEAQLKSTNHNNGQ